MYEEFNSTLVDFGINRSPIGKCFYKYVKNDGTLLVPIFVDDILPVASNLALRNRSIAFLEAKFGKLKQQTGPIIKHLGVRID